MHLAGANVDYLINISAFAARYNPKRVFEVIGALGLSYQATIVKDQKNNPFIRIEGRTTRETECIVCF